MNEEILKKLGYNSIALEMLLKREAQIDPEDIIFPGQVRTINTVNDDGAVEITLENIQQQFKTLINTIKSLPDTHFDEDYFGDLKREVLKALFTTGLKISSLMTQSGIDNDSFEEFINEI